jgi:uncharacterized membrane protein YGL010W
MSMYAAYHRNPVNKAIHFVMVPAIVWTLMVALHLVPLGFEAGGIEITLAMVLVGGLLLWYMVLDFAIGFASLMVFTLLQISAILLIGAVGSNLALIVAGIVFVASWVFQLIGHGVWEKRRPALMDNLLQVLVAPSFLVAEVAFGMGLKKELEGEVGEGMQAYLPA